MSNKFKIESIIIEHIFDDNADTSWLGKYTDEIEDGVIVRKFNMFYEDLSEDEQEELPERGREFRCFKPYAGGENVGTKEYKEYGMSDYRRMEGLNNGIWNFIGIKAKADIYFEENGVSQYQEITSGGLWGIESDSDKQYIEECEKEQIEDLKE